jgi:hypothetical protein
MVAARIWCLGVSMVYPLYLLGLISYGTYSEDSKCKNTTENNLPLEWQLRLKKDRHWKDDDHDVRRDVDNGVCDHVVGFS